MSKSYGNTITLGATTEEINTKVRQMITDPARIKKDDPGHPEVCAVYTYHKFYNEAEAPEICQSCKAGAIGCVACKKRLAAKLEDFIAPVREKRVYFEQRPELVTDIIAAGNDAARKEAKETLALTREAMGLS